MFYPGSGVDDDMDANVVNCPIVPLWKDRRSGTKRRNKNVRCMQVGTRCNLAVLSTLLPCLWCSHGVVVPCSLACLPGFSCTVALFQCGKKAFRDRVERRLLPALRAFNPDLILISAGFDAGHGDLGNSRLDGVRKVRSVPMHHDAQCDLTANPVASKLIVLQQGCNLKAEDFKWMTERVVVSLVFAMEAGERNVFR